MGPKRAFQRAETKRETEATIVPLAQSHLTDWDSFVNLMHMKTPNSFFFHYKDA